jgi:membrane-associated phospholipid phosphatase
VPVNRVARAVIDHHRGLVLRHRVSLPSRHTAAAARA